MVVWEMTRLVETGGFINQLSAPTMGGIMARTEVKEAEVSKSEMLKI